MSGRTVRALAPAKLNLVLAVDGLRDDGYHEVDTLMVALDWCDDVEVSVVSGGAVALAVAGAAATPDVPRDGRNLATRAAQGVLVSAGGDAGLALALEKRVPSGAGLGGGSADAAAAALAAARALGVPLPAKLLVELGADCAFFAVAAATGVARCTGRGEMVQPLPAPARAWTAVILVPEVSCPTAAVYRAYRGPLSRRADAPTVHAALCEGSEDELRRGLRNDLEMAALAAVPALRPVRALLDELGETHFRVTGSGSAFFGLYLDEEQARLVMERVVREADARGIVLRGARCSRTAGAGVVLDTSA